jgi:hypothetical protein
MQKTSVAAFLATVLVAVPAGWQLLGANIQTDGPALRPAKESFFVGDVTVSVEIDRGISTAGGTVKAILVATSDTAKELSLDVRALEDNGYGEERVQNPPTVVTKRRVKIKSGPNGGEPVEIAFNLGRNHVKGTVQWFEVDVMSSKTKYISDANMMGAEKPTDAHYYDDEELGPQNAARVGFATWSGNSIPISFVPTTIPATGSFEIGVKVKNTKRKAIEWLQVDLGDKIGIEDLSSQLTVSAYGDESPYEVANISADDGEPLLPGAERTYTFKITPKDHTTRTFTFMAHAHGNGAGAVEMMSFERPEHEAQPAIVGLATK